MRLYGGIDLHTNNCVVVLVDEDSREVLRKRIDNDISKMLALLEPYRSDITGLVVESTYNWYWLVDGLETVGHKVSLANTTAIQQYNGLKQTNDKTDARWLAKLLQLNILPTGYIYPKEKNTPRRRGLNGILSVKIRTIGNFYKNPRLF